MNTIDISELGILNIDSRTYKTRISKKFRNRKPYKPANPRIILSFIPGTVLDIMIKAGQAVHKGDVLMILDSMKMQNKHDKSYNCKEGR
jgi:biotin carboxyl carrier protein